jgi:hypothetical protein
MARNHILLHFAATASGAFMSPTKAQRGICTTKREIEKVMHVDSSFIAAT